MAITSDALSDIEFEIKTYNIIHIIRAHKGYIQRGILPFTVPIMVS